MAKLGKLLTGTIITGFLAAGATPAMAQDSAAPASPPDSSAAPPAEDAAPAPAPATPTGSGDIVITGSRIPQPNLTSASPVTVLNSQDIKLQGTTRTEDLINSLPQSFAAQGSNISNGATGIATINLRGLGSQRTMVLINGRRLMSGDPRQLVADVNFVPAALVKRVDVLTGGASSVYGADAVAGVVNFIMDTNFRGLRIDAQASTFMHYNDTSRSILNANAVKGFRPPHGMSTNGGAQDIAAAFGAGFDDNRGSITAYATYRRQDPVLQATRDYSFCALAARAVRHTKNAGDPAGTERDYNCGGSATSASGTFFTNVGVFHVAGNQFATGQVPFNFSPYNYYQRPDERYTLGAFAEYQISPGASPYLEAMFMNDHSDAQIAPSGDFANTTTLNCDNPLLSTQQFNTICVPANTFVDAQGVTRAIAYVARRNVEGGGRDDDLEHTAWRLTAGVKGDLLKGLSYDAYYQFGTSRLSETYLNDFSITRMTRALD
ncbi:MAG TPA: TonB-dependent receptor plug domain-containing protein, partial [Sphingomicrobium sp.]|nr:TonB-dependent receptor plug domain-containing protein [Sphingomicrobium sp.]